MSADSGIGYGTGGSGAQTHYDYNKNTYTFEKNNCSVRPPSFNGDVAQFSWWNRKMYSHIIWVDDELRNIIEDGMSFHVESEGMVVDRKSLTEAYRMIYMKHHIVCVILVKALPHSEYTNIVDKSTVKSIFEPLCSYERNQQVKETKANLLVHQCEPFRMTEDEDIEILTKLKISC